MPSTMIEKKTSATKKAAAAPSAVAGLTTVDVPFLATTKYAQRVVHFELKAAEAATLRGVLEALEVAHAKLESGKPVESSQDALRWILQSLGRGIQRA